MTAPQTIESKQAEMVCRQFNQAFTNTTGYGTGHPISVRSFETLVDSIRDAQKVVQSLTLMLDRDALFVEQHVADRKFNAKRLITVMKKIGLQSASFDPGLTVQDVTRLMVVLGDNNAFPDVASAKAHLDQHRVSAIKLNYVVFKKVTADDVVVGRDGLEDLTAQAARAADLPVGGMPAATPQQADSQSVDDGMVRAQSFVAIEGDVLSKISAVFSMKELFENPQGMAGNLVSASEKLDNEERAKVVGQLRQLTRQVEQGENSAVSLGDIMEAVATLRHDLRDGIAVQKQLGKMLNEEGTVVSEVDLLTYRTVVRIVREEYRTGQLSVKRLSQIIRRIIPDSRDIKRLLPQLKDALLAEGMPMVEYVKLVGELNTELQNDGLVEALVEGAEDVGLTVDDIVREIKANPREAARLVLLASEMKRSAAGDETVLSQVLTDYVERISGKMALDSPEAAGRDGGRALRTAVSRIEKELVERLRSQGVANDVLATVEERLAGRFQELLSNVKSDWLVNVLSHAGDLGSSMLMDSLESALDRQTEVQQLQDPLRQALVDQGYTSDQTQEFISQLSDRIKGRSSMFLLPRSVLSPNNTSFFLQREIKSYLRYKTPFSTLMVTFVGACCGTDTAWRTLTPAEASTVMPEIFKAVTSKLRDLDFVGSFGNLEKTVPFVILPMTEEPGAEVVRKRMEAMLREVQFAVGVQTCRLLAVVSATGFERKRTPDLKSFLQLIRERHADAERAAQQGSHPQA